MSPFVHLLRHGEVHNPDEIVYAGLEGFGLSDRGLRQAEAAAEFLATRNVAAIASSPLQRALETAAQVALAAGCQVTADERLTEFGLADRWAGTGWRDLPTRFPGELEAYLTNPLEMPFSPETVPALAERVGGAIRELSGRATGELVVVSHQDPLQAALLFLTGASLADLRVDPPGHAEIITLAPGPIWQLVGRWRPD
ncbi:MAG TPA: histidine phosphatase family protein [Acidimicrobiia bacterium]